MLFYSIRFTSMPNIRFACDVHIQNQTRQYYGDIDNIEICYVVENDVILTEANGSTSTFAKDSLICVLPDLLGKTHSTNGHNHHVTVGVDVDFEYTVYDSSKLASEEILKIVADTHNKDCFLLPHPSSGVENFHFAKPLLDKLALTFKRPKAGNHVQCLSQYYNLLSEITARVAHIICAPHQQGSCSEIIAYIENNLTKKLTLDDIANHLGFSKGHLCRIFKKYKNTTVTDYIITRRMELAGTLAAENSLTAAQIASAVGIDDQFYFSKLFLKYHGVNFSSYRISLKNRRTNS